MRALVLAAVATLGGCYKTTYHLRAQTPSVRSHVDDDFHVNMLNVFELSNDIDVAAACPGTGAVTLEERIGPVGELVNVVLGELVPVLHVRNASVDCAARASGVAAQPAVK